MPLSPAQAREALWRAGDLSYLLHEDQQAVRAAICTAVPRIYAARCARRWGKSWLACVLANEQCLQKPRSQVRYAAPTAMMVRKIVLPHMRIIMEDAPPDLRPEWHVQDGILRYPNGSEIHIAGVDAGGADRLRGVSTDLAIVDEAGFVDDLEYLVQSVLLPQLITTNGRILLVSTPAVSPGHAFSGYCARAELEGAFAHRTIYDAPHISGEQVEEYERESGGRDSVAWQREGMAREVIDVTRAVLPEWIDQEAAICVEHEPPRHRVYHVALDVGYHDLTHGTFGYHDFRAGLDVVEGEVVLERATSRVIDEMVAAKELELWGELPKLARDGGAMVTRHADAPPIVVAEMNGTGRVWNAAAKDDLAATVNALRVRVGQRLLRVHPRCTVLRAHCRSAIWQVPGRSWARMPGLGHFDGLASLMYWNRHINRTRNPYPLHEAHVTEATHTILEREDRSRALRMLASRRRP